MSDDNFEKPTHMLAPTSNTTTTDKPTSPRNSPEAPLRTTATESSRTATNTETPPRGNTTEPARKEAWLRIQGNLQQALNDWQHLTETTTDQLSPEGQQLEEMKELMKKLRTKIQEF